MIKRVDHIGVAVRSIEKAREPYEAMGLEVVRIMDVPARPVRVALMHAGDTAVELLEPTSADSEMAAYLEECGEGIHHICFEVDDVDAALAAAKAKGMRLIDEVPRQGASGRIAFLHPSSAHGVRIEFVEKQ